MQAEDISDNYLSELELLPHDMEERVKELRDFQQSSKRVLDRRVSEYLRQLESGELDADEAYEQFSNLRKCLADVLTLIVQEKIDLAKKGLEFYNALLGQFELELATLNQDDEENATSDGDGASVGGNVVDESVPNGEVLTEDNTWPTAYDFNGGNFFYRND